MLKNIKSSPFYQLLSYAPSHKKHVVLASICSVINKIFDIAPEILIGIAIDIVVNTKTSFFAQLGITDPKQQILLIALLTFFIWVGESLFEYLYMILWRGLAQKLQHEIRVHTYRHMQNLDLHYFEDKSTGNLVSILNDDINQLERFLDGGANQLLQTLTAVLGVGAVFFFISAQIAMLAFLPIPLILIGAFYFQHKAQPLYALVRDRAGLLSAKLSNNLAGIMTIKSFTREEFESRAVEADSLNYYEANRKAIAVSSIFIPVIRMAILCGFLATLVVGAWKAFAGELGVGSYGVLVFLTQRLLWPLTGLASTVDLYQRAVASTRRILSLIETPVHIQSGQYKPAHLNGDITFNKVRFQYASGPIILNNLSFQIQAKKTTAFVGTTGSGKSTLVKLLLRFYEIDQGDIFLDQLPLKDFDSGALRSQIGLVSQDVFLFHGSVLQNIQDGKANASFEDVLHAAKLAEAHDFIMNLPQQYETVIGERGQKLSGGQRQRISIARAIVKNPDILILDEATSSVDNETEAAIQKSLAVIAKNRTTIIIAHRLSTIVLADRIYVLENGEIKESGNHPQLLKTAGAYSNLWNVQTGGVLT